MRNFFKKISGVRWVSSLLFLIALFVITGIVNPTFFSYSNIIACFNNSCVFMLLAIGISFTIMTGEIDVSIGAVMGLTAAISGVIAQQNGSWLPMLGWAVLVGAVTGLVNGAEGPVSDFYPWHLRCGSRYRLHLYRRPYHRKLLRQLHPLR